jgi:hypothetical protein
MFKKLGLSVFILTFICGCALTTPYQPFNILGTGGYKNKEIDTNTQMVTYYTNMVTDSKKHRIMLLYRCAEATMENGYDYFDIVHDFSQRPINHPGFVTMQYGIKMFKGMPSDMLEDRYIAKDVIKKYKAEISDN